MCDCCDGYAAAAESLYMDNQNLLEKIEELRAQLASYEEVMRCAKNLVSVKGTLHNFMSIGLHADNTPAFKALEKAVRAAKEVRDE
jgi:cell division septum initiation protein DivIVA